jgi:predicted RNA methylase
MKQIVLLLCAFMFLSSCSKNDNNVIPKEMIKSTETIRANSGKVFTVYIEYLTDKYIKKAIIIDSNDMNKNVYFKIDNSKIEDKNGNIIINGENYGQIFYAWKIEVNENGFYIHPYWNYGKSTTDPIEFNYNEQNDSFEEFKIDKSQY